jgi:rRNA maturation RNase YbeY
MPQNTDEPLPQVETLGIESFQLLDTINEASPYIIDVFLSDQAFGTNPSLSFEPNDFIKTKLIPAFEQAATCLAPLLLHQENLGERLGLSPLVEAWELDVTLVNDVEIQALNKSYRDKDQPTDVLTFTLFAESGEIRPILANLPVIQLGSIFISLEWAFRESQQLSTNGLSLLAPEKVAQKDPVSLENRSGLDHTINISLEDVLIQYGTTRWIHGLLHLVGINHDTMEEYNQVVALQNQVLHEIFTTPIQTIQHQ